MVAVETRYVVEQHSASAKTEAIRKQRLALMESFLTAHTLSSVNDRRCSRSNQPRSCTAMSRAGTKAPALTSWTEG